MSPQQARGQRASVGDDIYSLGATLFDLLGGKPPFYTGEIYQQLLHEPPGSIAQRRAELGIAGQPIPAEWEQTVAACLAKGLAVVQGDGDRDLDHFPTRAFDYAILSKTLQQMREPRHVLSELLRIADQVVALPAQLAVLGNGDPALESGFRAAAKLHPGAIGYQQTFDEPLAHLIEGGAELEAGWLPPLLEGARNAKLATGAPGHVRASEGIQLLDVPATLDGL